jgi:peptidoglycan DL-endopeptidase CwlO
MVSGTDIINSAERYAGVPYSQRNPQSPATGLDCSGLVQLALANLGVSIPRDTSQQLAAANSGQVGVDIGTNIGAAQPGDVIHYPGHEEVYLGGGKVFSEATYGTVAAIRNETPLPIIGIVRYANTSGSTASLTNSVTSSPQSTLNPTDPSTWFSGLGTWIHDQAVRVGLIVFGAILILMGLIMAFKDASPSQVGSMAKELVK